MLRFYYILFSKLAISGSWSSLGLFGLSKALSAGAPLGLSWGSPGHPWVCGSPVALLVSLVLPRVGCWAGPWLLVGLVVGSVGCWSESGLVRWLIEVVGFTFLVL